MKCRVSIDLIATSHGRRMGGRRSRSSPMAR
jgi:hypothetical protein